MSMVITRAKDLGFVYFQKNLPAYDQEFVHKLRRAVS